MDTILNLTQHTASEIQTLAGVVEPSDKAMVKALLSFAVIPTVEDMRTRARALATIVLESGSKVAMLGGAPFFMPYLEYALYNQGLKSVYAFSERVSTEIDGIKTSVFQHKGFIDGTVGSIAHDEFMGGYRY